MIEEEIKRSSFLFTYAGKIVLSYEIDRSIPTVSALTVQPIKGSLLHVLCLPPRDQWNKHSKPSISDQLREPTVCVSVIRFSGFSSSSSTVASTTFLLREYREVRTGGRFKGILSVFDCANGPSKSLRREKTQDCHVKQTLCLRRPKQEEPPFIAAFIFRPSKAAAMENLDPTLTTQHHLRT